jgi:hypothetical protein
MDGLPEKIRSEFCAEARIFEGAFTSGHINEAAYRGYLVKVADQIFRSTAKCG